MKLYIIVLLALSYVAIALLANSVAENSLEKRCPDLTIRGGEVRYFSNFRR